MDYFLSPYKNNGQQNASFALEQQILSASKEKGRKVQGIRVRNMWRENNNKRSVTASLEKPLSALSEKLS